jgi:hypothetical protein
VEADSLIHVRVQHHPARTHLLPRLLQHLTPSFKVEVVEHSSVPPDPWAGYQKCLSQLPHCSHLLVIQDDALPAYGFAEVLPQIAARETVRPVCLWMSAAPAAAAARARRAHGRQRYVPLGPAPFVPLVAVLWPIRAASMFAGWAEHAARLTRADDSNVARWAKQQKIEFMVCVPSIVEHDDSTDSVKGGHHKPSYGRDRTRVAALLADDARNYDW